MGGGDLNLKKSWHPSTLRNIERVWKAEQKHEAEQQKIEQLQKELAEERSREEIRAFAQDQGVVKKKDERLEWMYQGPAALVNREEYLMGRKVDKTFEILQQQENGQEEPKDNDSKPGAIFSQSSVNTTVDLANKIREDPLFNIMKREKEERKSLLTNPVKMKRLQQMLQKSLSKNHKKKKGKKTQKRKHRHSSDSSDESSSDSDNNNYQREEKISQSKGHHPRNYHQKASEYKREDERYHGDKMRYEEKVDNKYYRNEYKHHRKDSSSEQKSSRSSNYQNASNWRDKSGYRKPSENAKEVDSHATHRNKERHEKKKLSEEEKESLRQAMMMNAKLRDEQRERNVKRYREDDDRENNVNRHKAPDFIRPMLSKAAEKGSVAGRVKQKIFTIQRNQAEMDRNFAKR